MIDVQKIALSAGLKMEQFATQPPKPSGAWAFTSIDDLQCFAALVLEEAAKACDAMDDKYTQPRPMQCAEVIRALKP